jgi:hypothetical protein
LALYRRAAGPAAIDRTIPEAPAMKHRQTIQSIPGPVTAGSLPVRP